MLNTGILPYSWGKVLRIFYDLIVYFQKISIPPHGRHFWVTSPTHPTGISFDFFIGQTGFLSIQNVKNCIYTIYFIGIEAITGGYKGLQEVTRDYRGLQGVTGSYNGLQGVTRGYKGLKGVTPIYRRLLGVTGGYRGLKGLTRVTEKLFSN